MLDIYSEIITMGLAVSLLLLNVAVLENIIGYIFDRREICEYGKRTFYGAIALALVCLIATRW